MAITRPKKREPEPATDWTVNVDGDVLRDSGNAKAAYTAERQRVEAARHARRVQNDRRAYPAPTLAEDATCSIRSDAAYQAVWHQLQSLNGEVTRLEAECSALQSGLVAIASKPGKSVLDERAERLLAGADPDLTGTEKLRGDLAATRDRLQVTKHAREFIRRRLGEEAARASAEIVERVKPEHRAIVARMAKALIELGKIAIEEREFRDVLQLGDVMAGSLRAMPIPALGDPRNRESRAAAWLREAIEHGLIERDTVPAAWLKKWEA